MGRKRIKRRLKGRVIRRGMKGKPNGRPQKAQNNPFDDPRFWLNFAIVDFCGVFGLWGTGNTEKQPPDREDNTPAGPQIQFHSEVVDL